MFFPSKFNRKFVFNTCDLPVSSLIIFQVAFALFPDLLIKL